MSEFNRNYINNTDEKDADLEHQEIDSKYLEEVYRRSKSAYSRFYNEAKTNVMIYGSDHYAKLSDNIRKTVERAYRTVLSEEERKKLTLNLIQIIIDRKVNKVISMAPGCMASPYKSDDIHQVKDAKLSDSVLRSIKQANDWTSLSVNSVYDYFIIGEVWANTYYDFDKGDRYGFEKVQQEVQDPMTGEIIMQEVEDPTKPMFTGEVVTELINGYDVFIEEGVDKINDSAWVGVEKLVHKNTVKYMLQNDPDKTPEEKKKLIEMLKASTGEEDYSLFDRKKGLSVSNKNLVLMKYFYFKPSPVFVNGKIFIKVKNEIFWNIELQKDINGKPIFPISSRICKRMPGIARGISPIRAGRSPQNELNRCYSKIAEHQVTLGDDKIVTAFAEGLSEGEKLQGIRHIQVGKGFDTFKHIPGRTGEQYIPFLEFNAKYLFMTMEEDPEDNENAGQADIKATLYKSMAKKMKYVLNAKDIEEFFIDISKKQLELAKSYYPDEKIIQAVGTCESVNIKEFKNLGPLAYNVKIEAASDDLETLFAKYLQLTESIQYASKEIGPERIGYILKEFPFIDGDAIFGKLVLDDKEADNIVLALDRGEYPPISAHDNNQEIVKALVRRRRRGDWKMIKDKDTGIPLPVPMVGTATVEFNYQMQYEARQQIIEDQFEQERAIKAGMIPMDGPLVPVGYWVNEPKATGGVKSVQAKVPVNLIKWAVEQAAKQGAYIEKTESDSLGSFQAGLDAMSKVMTEKNNAANAPKTEQK